MEFRVVRVPPISAMAMGVSSSSAFSENLNPMYTHI
jgi:hypothetical protein